MKTVSEHGRVLVTPEGVDLRLRIARTEERIGAMAIDAILLLVALALLSLLSLLFMAGRAEANLVGALWMIGFFLIRNFYFVAFETRPRAATPGKRLMGLRVVSRDGGRLSANAVFLRNLTREVEIFIPFSLICLGGWDRWTNLAGLFWMLIFLTIPLLTPDRTRVGDLIAGTCTVVVPKRILLPDRLAGTATLPFTDAQLDAYGIAELNALENVLARQEPQWIGNVAQRIRTKIAWSGDEDDLVFLRAYYIALRERLEDQLMIGKTRKDKFYRK